MSASVSITLVVKAHTQKGDKVAVTGAHTILGSWNPLKIRLMKPKKTIHAGHLWTLKIEVPLSCKVLEYRYLICRRMTSTHEDDLDDNYIIRHWESGVHCRSKSITDFGNPTIDSYGEFDNNKKMFVDQGWLVSETEIQIRLYKDPIIMFKKKSSRYNVRCDTVNLFMESTDQEDYLEHFDRRVHSSNPLIRVTRQESFGKFKNKEQKGYGMPVGSTDYVVYKLRTVEPASHGVKIDFYECPDSYNEDTDTLQSPHYLGYTCLLPVHLQSQTESVILSINNNRGLPIGQLTVRFLMCKPWSMADNKCDLSHSFSRWWRRDRPCLDIGHRGVGDTHASVINPPDPVEARREHENTLAGLITAAESGADFVEFDVQLSKDKVPIIWHDFTVSILLRKKRRGEHKVHYIPVHELNYSQLRDLRVEYVKNNDVTDHSDDSDQTDGHTDARLNPFPTLQEAFEVVDETVGFYVELKYPQLLHDKKVREEGVLTYYERNVYMDSMLDVIMTHAGKRRIVMASFDPDICSMARLKQNRYPVIYLIEDKADEKYYHDMRTWSIVTALQVAKSEKFLGLSVNADALLRRDEELLEKILEEKMICFVWGEKANEVDIRNELKSRGVHAICYDQIQHYKKKNIYRSEQEEKVRTLIHQISLQASPSAATSPAVSPGNSLAGSISDIASLSTTSGSDSPPQYNSHTNGTDIILPTSDSNKAPVAAASLTIQSGTTKNLRTIGSGSDINLDEFY